MFDTELYNYILNTGIDNTDDYIIKSELSTVLRNCTKGNPNIRAAGAIHNMISQIVNKAALSEMKLLSDFIFSNDIKAVFVKGVTTAYTVYDNPNDRNSGDIDVYVYMNQIELLLAYLAELGYYDTTTGNKVQSNLGIYRGASTHISPLARQIEVDGKTAEVCIEIHLFPFFLNSQYRMFQTDEIYNAFFDSAVTANIGGVELPVLPPDMNFVFMLDHFVKHMQSSLEADVYEGSIDKPIQIELLKLYEAKLYYEKYKEVISIERLIELTKKYNIQHPIDLAVHYLNEVFPNTVEGFYIDEEKLIGYGLSETIMCGEYRKYALRDIIIQNRQTKESLVQAVYLDHDYSSYTLNVPYRKIGASHAHFEINHEKPSNTHGNHLMRGEMCMAKDYSISGSMCWDERYLYIIAQVTDAKFAEENGNIVTFYIDNGKGRDSRGLKGFHVRINGEGRCDERGNQYHLVDIEDGSRWLEAMSKDCIFSFSTAEGRGFSFFIALPWEIVDVSAGAGVELKFDIILNRFDGYNLVSMSSLSCIRESYSSKYGAKMILCK